MMTITNVFKISAQRSDYILRILFIPNMYVLPKINFFDSITFAAAS